MTKAFSPEIIAQLHAPLSRNHIKTREQAGRTFSYLEAWHVIAEANRIFGFDGWDREMAECKCVAERETKIGQPFDRQGNPQQQRDGWRVGYVARVRVTVCGIERPVIREGTGYGSGIDQDLGAAHESAIKEAESDAMKRALMTFGNQFGLALYDKAQSNVEAPTRPAEASARPTASATQPPPRPSRLSESRDAILHAIEIADSPARIDGILRIHAEELKLIHAASIPTYDRIMRLAGERRGLLIEASPPRVDGGSSPALMGEP